MKQTTVIRKTNNTLTIELEGKMVTTSNKLLVGRFAGRTVNRATAYKTERKALNAYNAAVKINAETPPSLG